MTVRIVAVLTPTNFTGAIQLIHGTTVVLHMELLVKLIIYYYITKIANDIELNQFLNNSFSISRCRVNCTILHCPKLSHKR